METFFIIVFVLVFITIALREFLSLLDDAKLYSDISKSRVRVYGTVLSAYYRNSSAGKFSKRKKRNMVALVEFDQQSLADAGFPIDYPPAEVIVGNGTYGEGDRINCVYLPETQTMATRNAAGDFSGIGMGLSISATLMIVPLVCALGTVIPISGAVILSMFGVFCFAVGFFSIFPLTRMFGRNIVKIEGKISEVRRLREGIRESGLVRRKFGYCYTFNYNGKSYDSGWPDFYRTYFLTAPCPGDPVTVYFDTETEGFFERGGLGARAILGLAFLAVGILLFYLAGNSGI